MTSAPQLTRVPVDETPQSALASAAILRSWRPDRVFAAVRKNWDMLTTVSTSFGVFAIFAVQGIFMARLLGPEKCAEYGTAVLYTQTFTYIGLLGALLSIAGQAARNRDGLKNLRRSAIYLGSCTGIGTALFVMLLSVTALPAAKSFLVPMRIILRPDAAV